MEERLKFALRYEFAYETPLTFVRRFFESAFAPEVRLKAGSAVWNWQNFTERFIRNTTIFPLSQHFHPVYQAAAYLAYSRQCLMSQAEPVADDDCKVGPSLPEFIAGHPWYRFVDPAIEPTQLDFVVSVLQSDYKFLEALLSEEPEASTPDSRQTEPQTDRPHQVEIEDIVPTTTTITPQQLSAQCYGTLPNK